MNLSDSPGRPACPSRASGWSSLTTPWGLPCCVRFPCVHAVATTPAQRLGVFLRSFTQPCQPSPKGLSGRPAHRPFRGLLGVHSRYGLHTRAVTVYRDTLNQRLQPLRYLHDCSGCFRLERLPGGTYTHWKAPPCHGTHPTPSLRRAESPPRYNPANVNRYDGPEDGTLANRCLTPGLPEFGGNTGSFRRILQTPG